MIKQLRIVAAVMAAGLALMAGLVVWTYLQSAKTPTATDVRLINLLTTATMVATAALVAASEFAWRTLNKDAASMPKAFLVRLALREGPALLGLTVAYLAAAGGVLRVYPAYWVDLVPFGLFLTFLAAHWPSETL